MKIKRSLLETLKKSFELLYSRNRLEINSFGLGGILSKDKKCKLTSNLFTTLKLIQEKEMLRNHLKKNSVGDIPNRIKSKLHTEKLKCIKPIKIFKKNIVDIDEKGVNSSLNLPLLTLNNYYK